MQDVLEQGEKTKNFFIALSNYYNYNTKIRQGYLKGNNRPLLLETVNITQEIALLNRTNIKTSKMAWQRKSIAIEPDNLNLIPRTHMRGESCLIKVVL